MSPEQAAGRNDDLDERSDVYALCVLLYEWLTLEHPLKDKKTVTEVLAAIISGSDVDLRALANRGLELGVPAEWLQMLGKGLVKDREKRIQSVQELEDRMRAILDGQVKVECHVTLAKRTMFEITHWIDRHPFAYTTMFFVTLATLVAGLGYAGYSLLRAVL
jgi:serine/threonine protein kinase